MTGTKSNRERKNGASREQWQNRKLAFNSARPPQEIIDRAMGEVVYITRRRTS
jgi:hypothetical protein